MHYLTRIILSVITKVYDMDEMMMIADLCKKHNVFVISDEVYEWLVYPGSKFIKMGDAS